MTRKIATSGRRGRKSTSSSSLKEGDIVRPIIPGGPLMWVERISSGRARVWFYVADHFTVAILPVKYVKKVD